MAEYEKDEYEVPLRDQRYFGAGLKRKRVQFVASTESTSLPDTSRPSGTSDLSASERYLAIVMKKAESTPSTVSAVQIASATDSFKSDQEDKKQQHQPTGRESQEAIESCAVCRLPIAASQAHAHGSSIAHQVCLPHTYPPSSIDRQRKGLDYLQSYGWDPDQRVGLGTTGEGILHPIKAKEKRDRTGLGVETENEPRPGKKKTEPKRKPVQRLDAGKIRKLDAEGRKKDKQMRDLFYRNDEVEKYLGGS
ncbi:hypothetical protein MBLNU457_5386t1 [Dothideomycetes sp. NU457]